VISFFFRTPRRGTRVPPFFFRENSSSSFFPQSGGCCGPFSFPLWTDFFQYTVTLSAVRDASLFLIHGVSLFPGFPLVKVPPLPFFYVKYVSLPYSSFFSVPDLLPPFSGDALFFFPFEVMLSGFFFGERGGPPSPYGGQRSFPPPFFFYVAQKRQVLFPPATSWEGLLPLGAFPLFYPDGGRVGF